MYLPFNINLTAINANYLAQLKHFTLKTPRMDDVVITGGNVVIPKLRESPACTNGEAEQTNEWNSYMNCQIPVASCLKKGQIEGMQISEE